MDYEDSGSPYVSTEYTDVPGWPKVIGIISIVLASLGLVCGGLGAAFIPLQAGFVEDALEGDPVPDAMKAGPVDFGLIFLGMGIGLLLLFAGIWLVRRRPAARAMHLVWAVLSAGSAVINLFWQFQKQASLQQWAQDYPDNVIAQGINQGGGSQAVGQMVGLALGLVLGLGIPIFYLIWFGVIKTKPEQITGTPVEVD